MVKIDRKTLRWSVFIKVIGKMCVNSTEKYSSIVNKHLRHLPTKLQTLPFVKYLRISTESRHCMELPSKK